MIDPPSMPPGGPWAVPTAVLVAARLWVVLPVDDEDLAAAARALMTAVIAVIGRGRVGGHAEHAGQGTEDGAEDGAPAVLHHPSHSTDTAKVSTARMVR